MYPTVNRTLVLIKPKKPFIDWAKYVDNENELSDELIEETFSEYSAYLMKDVDDEDELEKIIRKQYSKIFENELAGWSQDESEWPQKRSYEVFKEWFEIISSLTIFDTDTTLLVRDLDLL